MQKPELRDNQEMRAYCPECNSICTFHAKDAGNGGKDYSSFSTRIPEAEKIEAGKDNNGREYDHILYHCHKCGGCGRGGLSVSYTSQNNLRKLKEFFPSVVTHEKLPENTPEDIVKEFREAETCLGNNCNRAASAMIRSTLEKILKANGYENTNSDGFDNMGLQKKIEEAVKDGVLMIARGERAKNDIKVLGDEVVHREWREISDEEVFKALEYTLWIIRDFYDGRDTIERVLKQKNRI